MILLATPVIAAMCTRSMRIGLRLPTWNVLPFSVVLGFALHPDCMLLTRWVMIVYSNCESAVVSMRPLTYQMASTL